MSKVKLPVRFRVLLAVMAVMVGGLVAVFTAGAGTAVASVSTQPSASQNWAGYVASGKKFSSVSGSWTEPTVTASSASSQAYSAQWVGLGGAGNSSSSLEQIGTGADYVNGQPNYYAWYELLPAGQVRLNLAIHPGDKISATVGVSGSTVNLSLTDTTTGQSVHKTLSMSNPDTSSAEWIVEAPAAESGDGSFQVLPLADFSKVTFSSATATADGHTGGISDSNWSATKVELPTGDSGASGGPGFISADSGYPQSSAGATTSNLSGDSFSVSWQADSTSQSTSSQSSVSPYPGDSSSGGYGYGGYGYGTGGYGYGSGGYGYGAGGYGYGSGAYGYGGYGYGGYSYGPGAWAYPGA